MRLAGTGALALACSWAQSILAMRQGLVICLQ